MNASFCIENYAIYNGVEKKALSCDGVFDLIDAGLCDEGALCFIDFESCADTFSSLKTVVFTPEKNSGRHPRLDIQVIDPDYKVHHLDSVPSSPDYCIVDGLFLVLDPAQTEDVDLVFKGKHSGTIEYSLLASLYKLDKSFVEFISDNDSCPEITTVTAVSGNPDFPLYKYQEVGATWINSVISEGVGCVLADEMGLGKTPQIISVLTANAVNGVSLVIVPNTLKENWRRELAKFSPSLLFSRFSAENGKFTENRTKKAPPLIGCLIRRKFNKSLHVNNGDAGGLAPTTVLLPAPDPVCFTLPDISDLLPKENPFSGKKRGN